MKTLNRLTAGICKVESFLVFALLLIMVCLSFWQVTARNLFSKGFHWADDFLRHSVLWTGLLAASLATTEGKHIKIDILNLRMSEAVKIKIEAVISFIAAGMCALIFKTAWVFVATEKQYAEMNYSLHVATWVLESIFPIAFGLAAFKFVIRGLNGLLAKPHRT
ncbi:MAG: TRAP transporter small permease [Nitrospirae bacterium]|nr:TRAP transporter small permease [Nitrospirota bacterium]